MPRRRCEAHALATNHVSRNAGATTQQQRRSHEPVFSQQTQPFLEFTSDQRKMPILNPRPVAAIHLGHISRESARITPFPTSVTKSPCLVVRGLSREASFFFFAETARVVEVESLERRGREAIEHSAPSGQPSARSSYSRSPSRRDPAPPGPTTQATHKSGLSWHTVVCLNRP